MHLLHINCTMLSTDCSHWKCLFRITCYQVPRYPCLPNAIWNNTSVPVLQRRCTNLCLKYENFCEALKYPTNYKVNIRPLVCLHICKHDFNINHMKTSCNTNTKHLWNKSVQNCYCQQRICPWFKSILPLLSACCNIWDNMVYIERKPQSMCLSTPTDF